MAIAYEIGLRSFRPPKFVVIAYPFAYGVDQDLGGRSTSTTTPVITLALRGPTVEVGKLSPAPYAHAFPDFVLPVPASHPHDRDSAANCLRAAVFHLYGSLEV